MSATEPLGLAIIGCGKVVQNVHLPALAKSRRCRLVAVCDSSAEVARGVAARYGVDRIYRTVDELLADDLVEAVLVAVGDPQHVTVACAALEAGRHVLVEKPLATSVAACAPLREAVATSGRVLQVGVMKRHDPGVAYARDAVRDRIGQPVSFSFWYRASADRFVDETALFLPVIRDPAYERPAYKRERQSYYLATHGAHLFDLVRFVVGPPVSVQAALRVKGETYSWHGLLRLRDGTLGQFELTVYVESDWSEGFDVFGERGSVSVHTPNPFFLRPSTVRVFDGDSASWQEPTFAEGDPYLRQLDSFAASIRDGTPPVADVGDGIAALALLEAVAASAAAGGTPVELEPGRG